MGETIPRELRLLLTFSDRQGFRELAEQVEWNTVASLAALHRVTGRLASAIDEHEVTHVPSETHDALTGTRAAQTNEFRDVILPQLTAVCDALLAARVTPTLLKGAALVASGTVPAGERPMSDIDVLVAPDHVRAAQRALARAGYHPRASSSQRAWAASRHYQDVPLFHPKHRRTVDLHWHLLQPHHRHAFDAATLHTTPLELPGNRTVARLSDRDQLAHLCLHFWKDRAAGNPNALGQLWDVDRMRNRLQSADWVALERESHARDHAGVVAAVVALTHVLLHSPLPPGFPLVAGLAGDERLRSFAITRVLAPRPAHIQLMTVTDDVAYRVPRVVTRVAAQFLRSGSQLRRTHGEVAPIRLRWRHTCYLFRLLATAARHPLLTMDEMSIDRWAHDLR